MACTGTGKVNVERWATPRMEGHVKADLMQWITNRFGGKNSLNFYFKFIMWNFYTGFNNGNNVFQLGEVEIGIGFIFSLITLLKRLSIGVPGWFSH